VNAAPQVIEAGANVGGKMRKRRLQLLREAVFVAVFHGKLERNKGVIERSAKLREHAQTLAPARAARLVTRGFEQLTIAAEQSQHILAQGS